MNNQQILITGGTGSFGKAFVSYLLEQYLDIARIVIYSRDEQKHFEMMNVFSPADYPVQYFLGDVRDKERILEVSKDIDILVHTASMKHIPLSEQNPTECHKTNILGSQNVIEAAIQNNVKKVIALSTDKAVQPNSVYGKSKMQLESIFLSANQQNKIQCSVVRFANVFASKGSVVPFFIEKKKDGYLPITHPDMTRFSITMHESINLVMFAIQQGWGGEVIIPISPSYRILDIAEAIAPGIEQRTVGIRQGEKLHEYMLTKEDAPNTVKRENYYILCPAHGPWSIKDYCKKTGATPVPKNFEYHSGNNSEWLNVKNINKLIDELKIK